MITKVLLIVAYIFVLLSFLSLALLDLILEWLARKKESPAANHGAVRERKEES